MRFTTKDLVTTAVMTAILCILGPVSIPIGPVPVSLTTFLSFRAFRAGFPRSQVPPADISWALSPWSLQRV